MNFRKYYNFLITSIFLLSATNLFSQKENSWNFLGPINIPGRILAVDIFKDGSTLYVASPGGGLWRTNSPLEQTDWKRVSLGYPVSCISEVAIHPQNKNIIFIGTGEVYKYQIAGRYMLNEKERGFFGMGIFRSMDNGKTWERSLPFEYSDKTGIVEITFNRQNPNTLFAATTEGVYRSTNLGDSWEKVLSRIMVNDILINPADTSFIVAAVGNFGSPGSGIYFSRNNGSNWRKVEQIQPFTGKASLSVHWPRSWIDPQFFCILTDSNRTIGLFKSIKFLSIWENINPNNFTSGASWYDHWMVINPSEASGQDILIGATNLHISNNFGTSFNNLNLFQTQYRDFKQDKQNFDAAFYATDHGIYHSTDAGATLQSLNYGLATTEFNKGVAVFDNDSSYSAAGANSYSTLAYKGNKEWIYINNGVQSEQNNKDGSANYLDKDLNLFSMGNDNYVRKFNFNTFDKTDLSLSLFIEEGPYLPALEGTNNPYRIITGRKNVFSWNKEDQRWNIISNFNLENQKITAIGIRENSPKIIAGLAGKHSNNIFLSENDGISWKNIKGNLPEHLPTQVIFNPVNSNEIFITFSAYNDDLIFRSFNNGETWENITSNLPEIPIWSVFIDPLKPDHYYIGNQIGVYFSEDAGNNWQKLDMQMDAIIAMDLVYSRNNRKIRVATHGNGVFEINPRFEIDNYISYKIPDYSATKLYNYNDTLNFEKLTVKNLGFKSDQTYRITFNIEDENQKIIYTENSDLNFTRRNELREISFSSFKPDYFGEFRGVLSYPNYEGNKTDSTLYSFKIVAPTILQASVKKEFKPYIEINSIRISKTALDTITLPFIFEYDGFEYDHIQISEKGWLEFGIGDKGTQFGVSSGQQLNNVKSLSLYDNTKPNKVLAPWWDNLNLGSSLGISGKMSYITTGIEPNRIFIVQWQNMQTPGTTRLNFQIKLYEKNNQIEFCYGPLIRGLYYGRGALVGLKDHIGGPYRFYNFRHLTSFNNSEEYFSINEWPGPDSAYVIKTRSSTQYKEEINNQPVLLYPYPNPFNSNIKIKFSIPSYQTGKIDISVFDALGRKIKSLLKGELDDGFYEINWDGTNNNGISAASGIYFIVLNYKNIKKTRKAILLR